MAEADFVFVNVKMPPVMNAQLLKLAREYNLSRSDIVRIACSEFLKGKRIVEVSELPGPATGEPYTPVPVVIVEREEDSGG